MTTETKWKCKACSKAYKTIESLDEHKRSKKHKKNEKEWLIKNPKEGESIFRSISHESSDILSALNTSLKSKDPEQMQSEVEQADKKPHIPTTLESLRICLFCDE